MGRSRKHEKIMDLKTHDGPFVTVQALAEYLQIDDRTIIRMIDEKALPAVKVGRRWFMPTEAVRKMLNIEQTEVA